MNCSNSFSSVPNKPCGEHGVCDMTTGFCVCEAGYSNIGDFSVFRSNPCELHAAAIQTLWGLTLIGVGFSFMLSIWGLLSRKMAGLFQWASWRLWIAPILIIIQSTILLVMTIGKFIDPVSWSLGVSAAFTVLHGFCTLLVATYLMIGLAGVSYTFYVGSSVGRSKDERQEGLFKMRAIEISVTGGWMVAGFSAFAPCAVLSFPKNNLVWAVAVHGVGFALAMMILGGIVAPRQLNHIIKQLDESISLNQESQSRPNEKLKRVKKKFQITRLSTLITFPLSSAAVLIFTLWPFMTLKSSYGLPVAYLLTQVMAGVLVWVTTTTDSLDLRRQSLAGLRRLSQALTSGGRKSQEKRHQSNESRTALDKLILPVPPT